MFIAILDFRTAATDRPAASSNSTRRPIGPRHAGQCRVPGLRRARGRHRDRRGPRVGRRGFVRRLPEVRLLRAPREVIRPMMIAAPVSRRYRADLVETVA